MSRLNLVERTEEIPDTGEHPYRINNYQEEECILLYGGHFKNLKIIKEKKGWKAALEYDLEVTREHGKVFAFASIFPGLLVVMGAHYLICEDIIKPIQKCYNYFRNLNSKQSNPSSD